MLVPSTSLRQAYGWRGQPRTILQATAAAKCPLTPRRLPSEGLAKDGVPRTIAFMVYVYLLESVHQREQHYVGLTRDLKQRLADHNEGRSSHTRKFKPWHLVSYFAFADENTAAEFETYLKSGSGKTFLKRHFLRRKSE